MQAFRLKKNALLNIQRELLTLIDLGCFELKCVLYIYHFEFKCLALNWGLHNCLEQANHK